ncbi:alcohol acetyltransferase-domain-containing protein [Dactylonectria estremocensis]|uniref:Alcohol acetyltransferase-domain-containing protein n=1 Tax=Dactylonectria estremocensis TaxID=1079267 RepID=A0A9P9J2F3_9HYPO|nr:alcohol acetyltransferase-domain-containing protein [Dactylonectria estremocensis]
MPRLRRLGDIEMYQSGLHNVRHYCGTAVNCRYVLPSLLAGFEMHKQVVQLFNRAVAQTVIQFPMLQVGLAGEKSRKPSWVHLPTIDLMHHIEWLVLSDSCNYDQEFQLNLQYHLDTEFDHLETRPGWRLSMMRTETSNFVDVMFVWNHANCDGMSAKIFHQTLLQSLNGPDSSASFLPDSTAISTAVSAQRFPPPQEKLARYAITMGYALSEVWHTFGPSPLSPKNLAHATWAPIHLDPYKTQHHAISIEHDVLAQILAACRHRGTTLTGLVHGIVLVSLASYLPKETATAFSSATAMDQRRFMGEKERDPKYSWLNPHQSVQNCVSSIYHTFDSHLVDGIRAVARVNNWKPQPVPELEEDIWSAAGAIREDIEHRLDIGLTNSVVGLMKLVRDWQGYHRGHEHKPRELSWIVTNLGVLDGKPSLDTTSTEKGDGWAVDEAKFALSAHVAGPFLQISAISVKGGNLSIHVAWQDSADGNRIGEQVAKDMEAWLRYLRA